MASRNRTPPGRTESGKVRGISAANVFKKARAALRWPSFFTLGPKTILSPQPGSTESLASALGADFVHQIERKLAEIAASSNAGSLISGAALLDGVSLGDFHLRLCISAGARYCICAVGPVIRNVAARDHLRRMAEYNGGHVARPALFAPLLILMNSLLSVISRRVSGFH